MGVYQLREEGNVDLITSKNKFGNLNWKICHDTHKFLCFYYVEVTFEIFT